MEKNEMVLHEIDSLIATGRPALAASKNQVESLCQGLQEEFKEVEQLLASLNQEITAANSRISELAEQERCRNESLETQLEHENSSQEIKSACEAVWALKLELAVAREQEDILNKKQSELVSRLKELNEKLEAGENAAERIREFVEDFNLIDEAMGKIEVIVQSHSFGVKIIKAQEEERRRVAREIHDGPAQAMANVIFLAEVCEKLIDIDHSRAKKELHELRKQVRGCLEETRKIIFDLRPMALDDLGLIPTVKRIADIFRERTGVKVNFKLSGVSPEPLDSHVEVSLFRIIQESLHNIEKHANASEVQVALDFHGDYVDAKVTDNGVGFDPDHNKNSDSFGLLGMRERVNLLNGELEIRSRKGSGTEISVRIPLATENAERRLA